MSIQHIAIHDLVGHPNNPRLSPREEVVDQIAGQLENGTMDEAHALIVRPHGDLYQIISGHHRHLAGVKAGLDTLPCWVREMPDDEAYMALVLNNAQGELREIEVGIHALNSGLEVKAYAVQVSTPRTSIQTRVNAARVYQAVTDIGHEELTKKWSHLSELHAAPEWLWPVLVANMVANEWSVEVTRKQAQRFKDLDAPPDWVDIEAVAKALTDGSANIADVKRLTKIQEDAEAEIIRLTVDSDRLRSLLLERLNTRRPWLPSQVEEVCFAVQAEQAELIRQQQQEDMLRNKREEEIAARLAGFRRNISLNQWKELSEDERQTLLNTNADNVDPGTFNKQENDSIEWAKWSWNPVTGCLHDCPYCYARDIANSARMAKVYPNGFEPTFRPASLLAPRTAKLPPEAAKDARYRNVFTCSMADLFGRWVPREWIEAVLNEMKSASKWNFLCLTKFPKRMSEFDIPSNVWMGTTVDLQARVSNAEAAFAKVNAGVKWLSIEPMLEPLKFKHLDRFDWVVIGGASASSETPEWKPPYEWIQDLEKQADAAGCKVYHKTNLLGRRRLELPNGLPIISDNVPSPDVFHYLGKAKQSEAA